MRCDYPKHWDACADPIWFLSEFLLPCQRVLYLVMGNLMKQPLNWDSVPPIHISTATSCIEWMVFRLCVKHLKWPHLIGTWPILCKSWFSKNQSSKLFVPFTQPPGHVQWRFGWSHPFHQWKIGGSCWRFLLSMQGGFPGNEAAAETWKKNKPIHQGIDWAFSCKNKLKFNQASRIFTGSVPLLFLVQLRVRIAHVLFWFFSKHATKSQLHFKKQGGDTHVM